MKRNTLLLGAIALAFVLIGVAVGHKVTTPEPAEPSAVDILFAQSMPDPQGNMQALAQWKNQPVVLNFWATWCAPCVEEMPELSELHVALAPSGPRVLGIGIDSAENITQFAQKYHIEFPLFVSAAGGTELARRFGNTTGGLPFTVLIDAAGQVRKTYLGRLKMEELQRDLAQL